MIKKECLENQISEEKAYIVRFTEHYLKRFLKRLLKLDKYGDSGNDKNVEENNSEFGLKLEQSYPNPANPTTVINFSLPVLTNISLGIYDILGREVCRLIDNEIYEKGWHNINWNGKTNTGNPVSSGTYIYRLKSGTEVLSGKIIMMK